MDHRVVNGTVILGIGNLLLRDEGVGIHVVSRMMKMHLPQNIAVVDGATATWDVVSLADGADRLIIVDAVKGGGAPGTIYRLSLDDVAVDAGEPLSLHHIGLPQMLDVCSLIGSKPLTVIIGVEPKEIDFGMELSPEIEERVPEIIELILEETIEKTVDSLPNLT
jgi:hydrogenase maturation protease